MKWDGTLATGMSNLVLAVEDDATQRLVLEWELKRLGESWGFAHAVAPDLGSARRMARAATGRVFILCDENLPDGKGQDFLREQRQSGHDGIVMTAGAPRKHDADIPIHVKPASLDEQRAWLRKVLGDAGLATAAATA